MDWLRTIAPTVASALGGPLAGIAVSAIGSALGWEESTQEKVTDLLQSGSLSGDQIAGLKRAEMEMRAKEQELGFKFAELEIRDRESAREREAKTGDSTTPRLLALLITGGFFGATGYLLVMGKPTFGGDALLVMLGSLGTAWTAVVSYYFGSTKGSADKTALLAKAAR